MMAQILPRLAWLAGWLPCLLGSSLGAVTAFQPEEPDRILENWRWRRYPELTREGVRALAEDSRGRLWFGTDQGILVLEGSESTHYREVEIDLPAPINAIVALPDAVYAGSEWGLTAGREDGWQRCLSLGPGRAWPVNSLRPGPDGQLLVSTAWGAILWNGREGLLLTTAEAAARLPVEQLPLRVQVVPATGTPVLPWLSSVGLWGNWGEFLGASRGKAPVEIWAVAPGGPAERAGVRPGDRLSYTGHPPTNPRDSFFCPPGNRTSFLWHREGQEQPLSLTSESIPGGLPNFQVSDCWRDRRGNWWFGLQTGHLVRFQAGPDVADPDWADPARWTVFGMDPANLPRLGWSPRLLELADGEIWSITNDRTQGAGVNQFDGTAWRHFDLESLRLGSNNNTSLIQTADGAVWIGGFKLHRFFRGQWSVFSNRQIPLPFHRTRLLAGAQGDLWIAGLNDEVVRCEYLSPRWQSYRGLVFQGVNPRGEAYFLDGSAGLVHQGPRGWVRHDQSDGLMDQPRTVQATRDGGLWAAGIHQGTVSTARLDPGADRWQLTPHPGRDLFSARANAIYEDERGRVWFGDQMGVFCRETDGRWTYYSTPEVPAQVYAITGTPDGSFWLGGDSLRCRRDGRWQSFTEPAGLDSWIECLCVDPEGRLWVGTRNYGVFSYDPAQGWRRYTEREGLLATNIHQIVPLPGGNLLAKTKDEMVRFDGLSWSSLHLPLFPNPDSSRNAMAWSSLGHLWYNLDDGYVCQYRPENHPPETRLVTPPTRVPHPGDALLQWAGQDAWLDTPDNHLTYSFRFDNQPFSPFVRESNRVFFALPAGWHTFEVRARDGDFNVDPSPALIRFEVVPAVWRQGWFIGLVLTLGSVIATLAGRLVLSHRRLREAHDDMERRVWQRTEELREANLQLRDQMEERARNAESLWKALEEVRAANRAKTDFLAVMSHEIRTPLNAILGFAQLLQEAPGERERRDFVTTILERGRHLLALISDILDFSSLAAHTPNLRPQMVEAAALVGQTVHSLEPQAREKGLSLVYDHRLVPPGRVWLDPTRYTQIVSNLLVNAIKFTSHGEVRVLLSSESWPEAPRPSCQLRLVVSDTGSGIPPALLPHIFEPFRQGEASLTRRHGGIGLGLAICKRLTEAMGGTIACHSRINQGTIFTVTLTCPTESPEPAPASPPAASAPAAPLENPSPRRILVAEDDAVNTRFIGFFLEKLGHPHVIVGHGEEALRELRQNPYDLVLMDVQMPVCNGLEATRLIRSGAAGEASRRIPIIGLTAMVQPGDEESCYAAGMNDYLSKPITLETLRRKIAAAHSRPA